VAISRRSMRARWRLRRLRPIGRRPLVWFRHLRLRGDDIVLDEYPKSGGTWAAFMLGEALFGVPIDFLNQSQIAPAVGWHAESAPCLDGTQGRLVRSHEPYREGYRRSIYLVRNVADVAVSYFHQLRWLGVDVELKPFLRLMVEGRVDGYGSWSSHVESWLGAPSESVVIVRYEDLLAEPNETLSRILKFIRIERDSHLIAEAVKNNTLQRMREKEEKARNTVFNGRGQGAFVRKGVTGDFRQWLDSEDVDLIAKVAGRTLTRLGYDLNQLAARG
jgi:hypothetical protein